MHLSGWTPSTRRAWDYVSQHTEGVTVRDVEAALKISRRGAADALENLYAQRYLHRVKNPRASKPAFFYPDPSAPEPPPTRPTRAMLRAEARLHPPIVKAIPQQVPERVSLVEDDVASSFAPAAAVAPLFPPTATCICGCKGAEHAPVWDGDTFKGTRCLVPSHGGHKFAFALPGQGLLDGNHESLAAAKRGVGETPKHRGVERANLLGERWLCKIDESHGPEISAQGYCARCERLYGPIA